MIITFTNPCEYIWWFYVFHIVTIIIIVIRITIIVLETNPAAGSQEKKAESVTQLQLRRVPSYIFIIYKTMC